ncbi:MAG: DMT family transporter, partial [Patescibacteria group bacterium]
MPPLFLFLLTMIPGTVLLGFYDVWTKKLLRKGIGEQMLLGTGFCGAGALFLVALVFVGVPPIASSFWWTLAGTGILNIVGQFAWYRAFSLGDVSLIAPLRVLTPIAIIFTGSLFLNEAPSERGLIGIALTVMGLFLLLGAQGGAFVTSVKDSIKSSGFLWGLFAVLAFSFSFPLDKKAILASSTLFFSALLYLCIGAGSILISWF